MLNMKLVLKKMKLIISKVEKRIESRLSVNRVSYCVGTYKIFWVGCHYINIEISEVSICYTILPSLDKSSILNYKACKTPPSVYMRCVGFTGWKSFHKMH